MASAYGIMRTKYSLVAILVERLRMFDVCCKRCTARCADKLIDLTLSRDSESGRRLACELLPLIDVLPKSLAA